MSTTTGMLLLAFGFMLSPSGNPDFPTAVSIAAAAGAIAYAAISQKPKLGEPLGLVFGFSFIGSALYKCILGKLWGGVAGVAIFTIVGLIGVTGQIKGVKKVDIFHVGIASSLFLVAQAMTQIW